MPNRQVSLLAAACAVALVACAQQPTATAPGPRHPSTRTAANDTQLPLGAATRIAQAGDEDEGLEDRARRLFGTTAPPATLPENTLDQDLLFKFLLSELAQQRGNLPLAAQGYLEMAKSTRDPRLAKRATEVAQQARQQKVALEAARLWLETDKDNPQARQTLAGLLVGSNKLQEAKPHLLALISADGNIAQGFLQLNGLLGKYPDKAAAYSVVKDLAKGYPQLPEAHLAVAQAAFSADKFDVAFTEVREALKLRPNWELAALVQGQMLQQRESNAKAIEYLQSFLDTHPKATEVRANFARLLISNRQNQEARTQYQLMLEEQPSNPDIALTIGLLSLQIDDFDAAETYLKRALESGYRDPDTVRFYIGQSFEERKRPDEAMSWYGQVSGGDQYVAARARYAFLLGRQNKVAEAREYLKQLQVQTEEQRAQLIQAEAQLLREAKAYQDSFEVLNTALSKQPDNPDLLYDTALAAEKLDRLDLVETNLRKLIQLKPENAQAYNALGYTLADRTDRYKEARGYIEKALKLAPDDPFILDSMGWVLYRMGFAKDALDYLQRAFALRPDPEIAAHLGEVLWAKGQHGDAEKVWREAVKGSPENELLTSTMKRFIP